MRTNIIVQNLKCGGCAKTIASKLSTVDNISNVEVDKDLSKVSFESDNESQTLLVKNILRDLGYPSIDDDNSVVTKAKSFVSCMTGKMS